MKVRALLPLKGYSERIPEKNIKMFGGSPLFFQVLKTLLECELVDSVVINTDCQRIANMAREFERVSIVKRPAWLCGDFVSMNEIIHYDINLNKDQEHFLQTHSTNPLLSVETLEEAIETYFSDLSSFDSLFSVTPLKTRLYTEKGPLNHDPNVLERTQDLAPVYEENSNIYIFSKSSFLNASNKRIGLKPRMFNMSKLEAIDIDEEEDFVLAESIFGQRQQTMRSPDMTVSTFARPLDNLVNDISMEG